MSEEYISSYKVALVKNSFQGGDEFSFSYYITNPEWIKAGEEEKPRMIKVMINGAEHVLEGEHVTEFFTHLEDWVDMIDELESGLKKAKEEAPKEASQSV